MCIASCRAAASRRTDRWIACRPGFFLPVRVLSRLFRRLFLERLQAAFDAGELSFFGDLARLAEPAAFAACLPTVAPHSMGRLCQAPFGGPEQVLDYLGRYTHRVAIANSRLVSTGRGPRRASAGRTIATTTSARS